MSRGTVAFVVFALAVSLGCVRLGFWQVSRLRERQARNAAVVARLAYAPVPVRSLAGDSGARFRRAWAEGQYVYEQELVLAMRSRSGSPGVHLLTPLRLAGSDTVLLVNRGWVYSADGMRVDLGRWREGDVARVEGFALPYSAEPGAVFIPSVPAAVRRLNFDSLQGRLPYPLLPVVLVQRIDSGVAAAAGADQPVRAEPPPLDEGSHRAYAVQWFGFALVGVVGAALVALRDRRRQAGSAAYS